MMLCMKTSHGTCSVRPCPPVPTCARLYSGQANQRPAACPQSGTTLGRTRGAVRGCVPSSPRLIELLSGGLNMGAHGIEAHTHTHPQATVSSWIQNSQPVSAAVRAARR